MRIKTAFKNKTGNKPAHVSVSLKQENIFDLIFGLDASLLKILAEEGSSKGLKPSPSSGQERVNLNLM